MVPTHGKRELLDETVQSLARQEGAPPFEVIIVDDGADPALGEHVAGLGFDLDVTVLHHRENRGRSAARNTGIRHASGEVIVFLDGDMKVVPEFVASHARGHEAPNRVVLGQIRTAPSIPRSAFVEYIDTRGVRKVHPGEPIPFRYFMTGNSSVCTVLLSRAGPFDEEFNEYGGEDTEMGYRLGAHGARMCYASGAVSYHLDLNSVPVMAERLRRYGETMLPILVRKAPQAREDLHLDLAEPPRLARDDPRALLSKAATAVFAHRIFWKTAAQGAAVLPAWLRVDPLFDVIRAAAYLDGYRNALREKK